MILYGIGKGSIIWARIASGWKRGFKGVLAEVDTHELFLCPTTDVIQINENCCNAPVGFFLV
ncbi:MAG: hypothetical protein V7K95_10845 [Nostoc sp.]